MVQGSYGYVHKVLCEPNGKLYAIKIISNQEITTTEIDTLKHSDCDYVVKFIKHWEHDGHTFIQMQYYPYNLAQIITLMDNTFNATAIALNPGLVRRIRYFMGCEMFIELLRALRYLHTGPSRIIHRDIKPANVMFDPTGGDAPGAGAFCKLGDFGLAAPCGPDGDSTVVCDGRVGTVNYRPPEAELGRSKRCSDVYSVGLVAVMLMDID
ncbi:unnamed protein product [Medioppia subpectinata]|uniref:Protein kinase domain-containing protein n=1 Tax=Medioppia subpectinata TaxID=1979941 RepID=A0A7R9PTN0_9ACAR|nr:unnamed protein product [Medioppia subpectinata]CAG2100820.1 unnamed protein product [Medioppia subpectinata]